jgi:hypothetical protein
LRTVLLPMRAAFFCPHCAQNGPESAAPQFRQAWVSNSASLTVVGVGWGGRGITRKERRRPGWGGLRIVGCGPAAAIVHMNDDERRRCVDLLCFV